MKAKLEIAHQVPGRIRMKIRSAKGDPAQLEEFKKIFGAIPGIEDVVVNPDTGSVVLKYDTDQHHDFHAAFHHHYRKHHHGPVEHRPPSNEIDALAKTIEQEAEFLAEHSHAARAVVDFCKHLDQQIKVGSSNTLDLKMVLAIGLVGVTVLEIGAAAATPVWVTLSLFGMNHFIEMQSQRVREAAATSAARA